MNSMSYAPREGCGALPPPIPLVTEPSKFRSMGSTNMKNNPPSAKTMYHGKLSIVFPLLFTLLWLAFDPFYICDQALPKFGVFLLSAGQNPATR